ncbi:DUF2796 domain-containing protein [Parasedimentitalea maritima]|uniref:DUF2796 domain-containing protein n=1 Tax=Parasedimentitalea maritima TaxID=2578117 RepID=A0ABY2UP01_9RHOB|nr:DUF2796 domain-containing protein [Zongyanglinia marina]TLP55998.1 DUF2796 domain-containing protein [Zongyanglinia marina]
MKQALSLIALFAAMPALANETRQLDAHEHGVGELNIAIEGTTVLMEFHAPGADIVGFEYSAKSDSDRAAVEAAEVRLSAPLELFVMPEAATCTVKSAQAELEGEGGHDDHADEGHAEHQEEPTHTEFHAQYMLTCVAPDALTEISFVYFEAFPNAQEVEVQIITASGAKVFEVSRDAPTLALEH